MKDIVKKILDLNLLKYLGIGYLSTFLNAALNLLMIRFLDPAMLGKVSLGKSIFQSFEISHFGIRFGLDRHLPHCQSDNESNEIFSIGYLFSFLFSFAFVFFWIFYEVKESLFYSFFYVSGLLYTLISVYRIYYRAQESKNKFIQISFYSSLLPVTVQLVALWIWGVWGFIIGHLLSYIIVIVVCYSFFRIRLVVKRDEIVPIFKKLFSSGYLLFLSSMVTYFSSSGDRFFIAHYWGLEELGIFSTIMFFFSVFNVFAVNYTEMIMNKIIVLRSFVYILRQIIFLVVLTIVLVVISYYIIPYFVSVFIPQYIQYTNYMSLILVGAIPYAALPILNYFLHAIDKRIKLLFINVVCTILYFIVLLIILKQPISLLYLICLKISFFTLLVCSTLGVSFYYRNKIPVR